MVNDTMNNLEKVETTFADLPYMQYSQAKLMRDLIIRSDARDILEIGFLHGKSSAYFAAILEDLGRGHLVTIDFESARRRKPSIDDLLGTLGLAHRVTPHFAHRSYTWELAKMIRATPRPQFDLCYFDGGHTWDPTGFGFFLVDMLLRPGAWIVFDDLEWTIESAIQQRPDPPRHWRAASPDERSVPAVKLTFDLLVPHLRYTDRRIVNKGRWGIARKPVDGVQPKAGLLAGLRQAFALR
jgi:predicted O-methyltransferase YrrM